MREESGASGMRCPTLAASYDVVGDRGQELRPVILIAADRKMHRGCQLERHQRSVARRKHRPATDSMAGALHGLRLTPHPGAWPE